MNKKLKKVLEEYKNRTAKECYEIKVIPDEEPSILDDKLGGTPYFPANETYPVDSEGNPMELILQVDLGNIDLDIFPNKGILSVFTDGLNYPAQYKIFCFEKGLPQKKDLPRPVIEYPVIGKPLKIKLEKTVAHMPPSDYRSSVLFGTLIRSMGMQPINNIFELQDKEYNDFTSELSIPRACIGGYADFTQSDPREYGDNDKDECLFKLDSGLGHDIDIGDSGIMWALITQNDLTAGNFDKAELDWDCC